ncbi:MAG: amino acid ABC transporter permease [Solobacterium sp.]|jgi:His/Glu/Gln/Arg/opine family amino acid ABC transporter permease subunit|nr:amino acid ABC transporter permease [Solobacterium sp.]MBR3345136.1 amino acid ABC transporter permease [Solobacterium sp.]HAE17032.1 arginine ABC transporter permease [Erysipelotrichaceae bacterium]
MGKGLIEVFLEYWPIFLKGAAGTLQYAFIAVFFGTILGSLIAIGRLSKNKILNTVIQVYVTVIRGTPLLVQMYIAYYFLPMAFPAMNDIFSKEFTVMLALIINSSAYVSEIIRSGINSVDKGQTEAARSLGLTASHTMTKIIMPQAIKNILPALANEYIAMIKETSLAGTFMMYELMYTRTLLANKYLFWQPLFIIAGIYLIMTVVLSWLIKAMERRFAVSD